MLKTYDPLLITFSWNGILVQGYAENTFLKAERSEATFSVSVGAGGDVTRVRSRNRTGMITVTLQAESPTNDLLSAAAELDELFGNQVGPAQGKNLLGTTLIHAEEAWIVKPSDVEYAKDAGTREWQFGCALLEMVVGGAVV